MIGDWRLRRAEPGDAPALALVAGATFLETFAGMISAPDMLAHLGAKSSPAVFADWIADARSAVTIAEAADGGAPLGYAVVVPPDLPIDCAPDDLELRRIYALGVTRGTGIGHALMTEARAEARALGARRLLLGVNAANARARAFYEREGFALAGERRFLVGATWHQDVLYAQPL